VELGIQGKGLQTEGPQTLENQFGQVMRTDRQHLSPRPKGHLRLFLFLH